MSSVDSRIVTMKFDNASFERNARTSLSTLERLKQSMNFGSLGTAATKGLGAIGSIFSRFGVKNPFAPAQKGLSDLSVASNQFGRTGFGPIEGGITNVSKSFMAMSTIAITALSNITTAAMRTGSDVVKGLTIDPVKTGLSEYETNLNSIQTILANTKVAGTNLEDVNAALDELNRYSDKTIYNFSEMAKNIGTFTAAGVDLKTATASIKGIANLAALSGSNSQQAATAMYQLSQEIASGRVSLMGWNSVVNAGMGGSVFQRALVQTAQNMGTLEGKTVEFVGKMKNAKIDGQSFRDSIMAKPGEVSWLSSKVLTDTLAHFTADMTDAELASEGFNKAQIKSIQTQARMARDAATKVKTLTGVLDTAKEVVGSGWAKTWQLIFGDFKEARKLFTNLSVGFNHILENMAKKRNEVLAQWKIKGGRDMAIEGAKTAWKSLLTILKPIGDAFRDIFPKTTSRDLMEMTRNFMTFAKNLKIGKETAENLRRTFGGVFAIFSILGQVVGAAVDQLKRLFGEIGDNSGGILNFTGGIGDAIVAFDQFLEKSGVLKTFFKGLGDILSVPLSLLAGVAKLIGGLFDGFDASDADKISNAVGRFNERVAPLQAAAQRISVVFEKIGTVLSQVGTKIGNGLSKLGELISGAITPETFSGTLDVINTSLFGALVLMIRKFFTGGLNVDLSGGLFDGIKETLGAATGALQNMQANLKADILMKIAIALGILAASLVVLATIDGKKLAKAMVGMSVGFAGLSIALTSLSTAISFIGAAKLPLIASSMMGIAASLLVLSLALKVMSTIDITDTIKTLGSLGIILFMLTKSLEAMSKNSGGTIRAAAALLILSVALNAIAIALKIMSSMSWEELGRGLVGVAGALVIISGAMRLMPKGMIAQAAAITVLGVALNAIGIALKIFASMSMKEIGKGLLTMAGALGIIALAMRLMPKGMVLQAAALTAVGVALNLIGLAVKNMGKMGWEEIAKGLVTLAGALLILAVGLNMMNGTLLGAAALVVAAGALTVITPVLITLGTLKWETIIKGLTALAGIFVVLGVAGALLTPVIPTLLGLSVAMVLIGGGLALAGAGALAFATAFGIVVATGTAGIKVLGGILKTFVKAIPMALKAFGQGIVEMARAIGRGGAAFTKAFTTIMSSLLDAVIKTAPKMGRAFNVLINTGLNVLVTNIPKMVDAGLRLLAGILTGIDNNITKIVKVGASIIVKFLNGLGNEMPRITDAGFKMIIKFIDGTTRAINNNSEQLGRAGGDLAWALVQGMIKGIVSGTGQVASAAWDMAKGALKSIAGAIDSHSPSKETEKLGRYFSQGFAVGIVGSLDVVETSLAEFKNKITAALDEQRSIITDNQAKLKKLRAAKDKDEQAIRKSEAALRKAKDTRDMLLSTQKVYNKDLKDEQKKLRDLATQYDDVVKQLEDANQAIKDAEDARDNFGISTAQQYTARPEIGADTTVGDYTTALYLEQLKVEKFHESLNKLVSMGMDDASYQRFIDEGVGIQPFLDKLIEGGPAAVAAVDDSTAGLALAAQNLGQTAKMELYEAAVESAKGFALGIESQKTDLENAMTEIATTMIRALKKKLKIKSPSREFMAIGKFSNQGLAKGLETYSGVVDRASAKVGASALDKMRASMSQIGDSVTGEMDVNPTISPVLDLTQVQKSAAGMGSMFNGKKISAEVSYGQAASIYSDREAARAAAELAKAVIPAAAPDVKVELTQNNYSPEALSPVDIYRQTKNQLSLAKEALA